MLDNPKPEAIVEKLSKYRYRVYIQWGFSEVGPDGYGWIVWGHKRAVRFAHRRLTAFIVNQATRRVVYRTSGGSEAVKDA